jgi:hypothetical protein
MPTAPMKKRWTVMVYMAGDNSLDPEGVKDLTEMKKVGSTDQVNIVAQFDRAEGHVARRYALRKGGIVTGDAVASLGTVNTGDPAALTDFIKWAAKSYPANHYLLILWNHGQGWDDTDIFADERFRAFRRLPSSSLRHAVFHAPVRRALKKAASSQQVRAILLDDDAKDFLDNHEMGQVLSDATKILGQKLDILGMDACLMSMAEVGYQVEPSVDYTVGSEQTEPGNGWPYDTILAALVKKPTISPKDLSKVIVSKYLASYGNSDGVTQSACDLGKAEGLAAAIAALAQALTKGLAAPALMQAIQSARNRVQSYEVPDNIDLVDFCSLLDGAGPPAPVRTACAAVIKAVTGRYVVANGSKGKDVEHSNGVAIYFPLREVSPLYAGLELSKRTGWDAFLASYLKTLRSR